MEPTIYKPSIYKGAGIYKIGSEGGGGVIVDITKYQGSRGTPTLGNNWPNNVGPELNRVCSQPLYLNTFIGKKLKISTSDVFLIGAIDGTQDYEPFNSHSWASTIELIIEYGTITISAKKIDNSNLTPNEINISVVLTNE